MTLRRALSDDTKVQSVLLRALIISLACHGYHVLKSAVWESQGPGQLCHHRLLSLGMYQAALQTHKACLSKGVLHQSVLMNSSVLSNKLI